MVSTRVRIAVACGAVALLGGACGGGGGQTKARTNVETVSTVKAATPTTVATTAEATKPRSTDKAAATTPQTTTVPGPAPAVSATPTAEEVQAIITSMNAQLAQAAGAGPDTPAPTSDEIEAQLLDQLRQLGIPL